MPIESDAIPEITQPLRSEYVPARFASNARWGAIAAGVAVTASTWLVLHLFGMGVGLTAIDPDDAGSLKRSGIGVGVWSMIAPVIALFIGGLVVSRLAPSPNKVNRMLHGALVWSLATLVGAAAIFLVTSSLVRGAAQAGGVVAGKAADVVSASAGALEAKDLAALGLDGDAIVGNVNQRLKAAGKPPVTGEQLTAAARGAAREAVQTGSIDRAALVRSIARNTDLTTAEVNELATKIEGRWNEVIAKGRELAARAESAGLQAAETTGQALMLFSLALLLGLGAALGGSLATGHRDRRRSGGQVIESARM